MFVNVCCWTTWMTQKPFLIDAKQLGNWMADRHDIWQLDLLTPDKLTDFCKEREIRVWKEHIELLWQLGLLRADIIFSGRKLRRVGITYLKTDEQGYYLYA